MTVKLYKERDYTVLTAEELAEYESLYERKPIENFSAVFSREREKKMFRDLSKGVRHFDSLFPNNFLDPVELVDTERLLKQLEEFKGLLKSEEVTERKVLDFVNNQEAYFIIASVLKEYYHFGHHEAFLFPEFQLGNSYKVDYLLVGKSSDGWSFVFVELEAPIGLITMKNGELGGVFRKGIEQIKSWNAWLEAQYSSLKETFDRYRRRDKNLPDEFFTLDKSRVNFLVVAGKRINFTDHTYRERRSMRNNPTHPTLILHYDNLIDTSKKIVGQSTY